MSVFHCLNFVITVMTMCKFLVLILMITLTHLPGPVLPVRLEDVSVKVVFVELLFNEREPDGIFCPLTHSPILSSCSTFKTITAIVTWTRWQGRSRMRGELSRHKLRERSPHRRSCGNPGCMAISDVLTISLIINEKICKILKPQADWLRWWHGQASSRARPASRRRTPPWRCTLQSPGDSSCVEDVICLRKMARKRC